MISLKSRIAQSVLGYFMLHESAELYINEMARRLSLDDGNLVRKLKELEAEGILKSELKGKERYYSLNQSFPLLHEYKKIVLKTVGLEHTLKRAIEKVKGIKQAVLFGSYAEDRMDVSSDIDLLVIGDHDTIELQKKIAAVQKTMDREINLVSMGEKEYEKKKKTHPLLKSIAQRKKISLL